MNETTVRLVQRSWKQVVPIADTAADLFYDRLFELDYRLRAMFPADLSSQKKKLMQVLGMAVGSLTKLDALVPTFQDLGRRHAAYGVQAQHYDTVGAALIWTLEQGLGDAFTSEVREAWTAVYGLVAATMQQAAAGSDERAA